jgi:hypothetical protein
MKHESRPAQAAHARNDQLQASPSALVTPISDKAVTRGNSGCVCKVRAR